MSRWHSQNSMTDIEKIHSKFFKKTGLDFKDKYLLLEAMSHKSFSDETYYQRLEFLGDGLLSFFSSEYFFRKYGLFSEGELSKAKTEIINRDNLSNVFDRLGFSEITLIDTKAFKAHIPQSIKEDIIEAVLAALYIDSGIRKARKFFSIIMKNSKAASEHFFAKNDLQEMCMKHFGVLPTLSVTENGGIFCCKIHINGKYYSQAEGATKKECEKKAALNTLKILYKETV